jgi:hypothetical protein
MTEAKTRVCQVCCRRQPLDDFYLAHPDKGLTYRRYTCKGCYIARQRELQATQTPEAKARHARSSLSYYYRNRDRILKKKE